MNRSATIRNPHRTVEQASRLFKSHRRDACATRLKLILSGTLYVVCIVLFVSGCATDPTVGYSTTTVFPTEISTVAVPIFQNETFERDVEFELTDALIKAIEATTPYKVIPEQRADSILTGRIVSVERKQLSRSFLTGLSEEVLLSMTIDFEWRNLRTGKTLIKRASYTSGRLFVPSRPTGEPIELAQFAVVQKLATDIVNEMHADW